MLKFPLDTEYSGAVKKKLDGKVPIAEFKKCCRTLILFKNDLS